MLQSQRRTLGFEILRCAYGAPLLWGIFPSYAFLFSDKKVCGSVLFAQVLYYQIFFDIAWIIFWVSWIFATYWQGLKVKDDDVVRTVFMLLWLIAEPIRILVGRLGNLQENVPYLVLFCILSVAPLEGTAFYILTFGYDNGPANQAVQICQLIMLNVGLILGIYTVRRIYRMQKHQFYLFEYAVNRRREETLAAETIDNAAR